MKNLYKKPPFIFFLVLIIFSFGFIALESVSAQTLEWDGPEDPFPNGNPSVPIPSSVLTEGGFTFSGTGRNVITLSSGHALSLGSNALTVNSSGFAFPGRINLTNGSIYFDDESSDQAEIHFVDYSSGGNKDDASWLTFDAHDRPNDKIRIRGGNSNGDLQNVADFSYGGIDFYRNLDMTERTIFFLEENNGNNDGMGIGYGSSASNLEIFSDASVSFKESDSDSTEVYFNLNEGRVGIGTTNPDSALDVVGDIDLNNNNLLNVSEINGMEVDNLGGAAESCDKDGICQTNTVSFDNHEHGDYDTDGLLYWDLSAGLYIKSSNATNPQTGGSLLWSSENFTAGSNLSVSYDSEDEPTLSVVNSPTFSGNINLNSGSGKIGNLSSGPNIEFEGSKMEFEEASTYCFGTSGSSCDDVSNGKLHVIGNAYASGFYDRDNSSYYINPANSGTSGKFNGNIVLGGGVNASGHLNTAGSVYATEDLTGDNLNVNTINGESIDDIVNSVPYTGSFDNGIVTCGSSERYGPNSFRCRNPRVRYLANEGDGYMRNHFIEPHIANRQSICMALGGVFPSLADGDDSLSDYPYSAPDHSNNYYSNWESLESGDNISAWSRSNRRWVTPNSGNSKLTRVDCYYPHPRNEPDISLNPTEAEECVYYNGGEMVNSSGQLTNSENNYSFCRVTGDSCPSGWSQHGNPGWVETRDTSCGLSSGCKQASVEGQDWGNQEPREGDDYESQIYLGGWTCLSQGACTAEVTEIGCSRN